LARQRLKVQLNLWIFLALKGMRLRKDDLFHQIPTPFMV
jgi:hypothetical protein